MTDKIRGYVICGEGRTGTHFLCEAAFATGKLGNPKEYFNASLLRSAGNTDYADDREAQVQTILSEGASLNGVYGFKLFAPHFDELAGFDWTAKLPNLQFVYVTRRNLLMRAISFDRASQSGQWRSGLTQRRTPLYDEHAISAQIERIALADARWEVFFARNGIEPLRLVYEEFVKDNCSKALSEIATLCGVDDLPVITKTFRHEMQRDELSYEWAQKFVAAKRDLKYLDRLHNSSLHNIKLRILNFYLINSRRVKRILNFVFGQKPN